MLIDEGYKVSRLVFDEREIKMKKERKQKNKQTNKQTNKEQDIISSLAIVLITQYSVM